MNFEKEVIERSHEIPVLVDFWAPWCGPCVFLGPILEELAVEANGKWELVKVDVDENSSVSRDWGIRGIPDVKMFHKGRAITNFTGSMPKHQIEQWIEENFPDERITELENIKASALEGDPKAIIKIENMIKKDPNFYEGKLLLAKTFLFSDTDRAEKYIAGMKMTVETINKLETLNELLRLIKFQPNGNIQISDTLQSARSSLKNLDFEKGIESLIQAIIIDKNYLQDLPRKSALALFNYLGQRHALTLKFRKQFDMALY